MRNIRLTIEYDGSRFQGWQRLGAGESTANTISGKLCEVLSRMTGQFPELFCASRTETGVHAYAQTVNFHTDCTLHTTEIRHYLNRYLPSDIAVLDVQEVPERFHASLNAKRRTYRYRLSIADVPDVFERKYVYHLFKKPDVEMMRQAARLLIGRHDFQHFSSSKKKKGGIKEVFDIDIYQGGEELEITIRANDFLHNMARIIVSTLLDVGQGMRPIEDIPRIFSGEETASDPIDPKGLFFQGAEYPQE